MGNIPAAILRYLAYAAGLASAAWLAFPSAFRVLLVVMLLDIVAGFVRAIVQKTVAVQVAWSGVGRKAVTLAVIGLVYAVSGMLDTSVGGPLVLAVIGYYCYVEVLSVVANAAACGVPIPDWLRSALAGLSPDKIPPSQPPSPPAV
jgi:toxin secretion/phage lysis holin